MVGIEALQLDHSRPVRRAAALLCRELYSCALKEVASNSGNIIQISNVKVARALVESEEDLMYNTIKCAIFSSDVCKTNHYDPAFVSRCEEALHTRTIISDRGIFSALSLIVRNEDHDKDIPQMLKNIMKQPFCLSD